MGWGKIRIVACLALAVVAAAEGALSVDMDACRIVSESEKAITFTVELPSYSLERVTYGGETYSKPVVRGFVPFASEGAPDLPVFSILLAVPPGGDASLESFSRSEETAIGNVRLLPVPRIAARGEGPDKFPEYVYEEGVVYEGGSSFPDVPVWLEQRGRMRHQDVVRVIVSPFIYEPDGSRLLVAEKTTVTVRFEGRTGLRSGPRPEDEWEGVYRSLLLNYEQSRDWRTGRVLPLKGRALTNDRLKILIDETGIHEMGFDLLSGVGLPAGTPVDDIFMYREEFTEGGSGMPDTIEVLEIAAELIDTDEDGLFSEGDKISFYGRNFYDEFGYKHGEDYFFDKNVYWLSWADGEHERMSSRSGWRDALTPSTPQHFPDFIHVEKDSYFVNFPPGDAPIDFYTWRRFSASFPFDLPGLDATQATRVNANFISFYSDPSGLNRTAVIILYVKGCEGDMTPILTTSVYVPSTQQRGATLDPGVLCEEGNTFRFASQLPSHWTPGNTLDWLEVFYERKYEAVDDWLVFTSSDSTGELEFEVAGFSSSDILLFDVTDAGAPVRIDVPPERIVPDDGGFRLVFRDSIAGEHKYLSLCSPCVKQVGTGQIASVPPPALRDASGDYVIITHPDFVSELDPLIDLRRDQGYSILLATTDEVYDDFGNGMKSDLSIRRFIKSCFLNGDAQFALLVGDASVDRRGLLLDPPLPPPPPQGSGQFPSDVDYLPSHNLYLIDGKSPNREIRPNDNWFASLDGPADLYPDLYIGRLPVGSTEEAAGAVAKILNFENYEGDDPWKKRMILFADDYYRSFCFYSIEAAFEQACDSAGVIATDFAVVAPDTVRYYLERCTRDDQPDRRAEHKCVTSFTTQMFTRANCTPDLLSLLNSGALLVNYQGHANRQQFTHETLVRDYDDFMNSYRDIRARTNFNKPFVFLGFGCWMSDFQVSSEGASIVGDAIGEKFITNPNGAGCASFASACGEYISDNRDFNPFITRAMFTHLQGLDPRGNPIPARILLGEAVITGLVRFAAKPPGHGSYIQKHVLLGDPAMVVDMGAPLFEVTANDSLIDETYVFTAEDADTLHLVSTVKDEEAIMQIGIETVEDSLATPVDPGSYESRALVDTQFTQSRAYEVSYDHVPLLGEYSVRLSAEDYSGKAAGFDVHVNTGSATFFKDGVELREGDMVVFGQRLRVRLRRPLPFTEDDIAVYVDTIPAEDFHGYSLEMTDVEGMEWEVAFAPSVKGGTHTLSASVKGLRTQMGFRYIPARVEYFVEDKRLYDNDYVSPVSRYDITVNAEAGITQDDIGVELNGERLSVVFLGDTTGSSFASTFDLELEAGGHQLATTIKDLSVPRSFQVSQELALRDVSVYPNPFSDETYFFYTLSQDAEEAKLYIYTVSGRKILEDDLPTLVSENQHMWNGRDLAGDRIANGTYLYRIVAKSGSHEKESTGWVVKVE